MIGRGIGGAEVHSHKVPTDSHRACNGLPLDWGWIVWRLEDANSGMSVEAEVCTALALLAVCVSAQVSVAAGSGRSCK